MTEDTPKIAASALVAQASWFRHLPAEALAHLSEQSRRRRYAKGQFFMVRDEVGDQVFGMIEGRARASVVTPAGRLVAIADLVAPDWFGGYSLVDVGGSPMDIEASVDCEVLAIPVKHIRAVGEKWPELYRGLFEELALRSKRMVGLVELVGAHELSDRLAIRLLMVVEMQTQREPDNPDALIVRLNQSELASLCFGTRQTVNRVLAEWADEGLLEVLPDGQRILDVDGMIGKARGSGFIA